MHKKKIVRVPESELVSVMENIVKDAVAEEKKKWIAEQESKRDDKVAMLETQVKNLSATVSKLLSESK